MRRSCYTVAVIVLMVLLSSAVQGINENTKRRKRSWPSNAFSRPKLYMSKTVVPDETTVVTLYDSVTLTCEATGVPPPTVHWLFNGKRIQQGSNDYDDENAVYEDITVRDEKLALRISSTRSRLRLSCVDDTMEGQYSCIAETPYMRKFNNTLLVVDDTDEVLNNECAAGPSTEQLKPPFIYMWSKNRLEFINTNVRFYCRARGIPRPTIEWLDRDKKKIEKSDKNFELLPNGDLIVKNIAWSKHMGRYICRATNLVGRDSAYTFLYPTSP